MPKTTPHFDQIRSWLNEINREKQASVKSAKAYSEPSGRGSTTHPIKDQEDNLTKATEGARSAENERDIKELQPAGNINESSDSGPSQDSLNYNLGLHQSSTGEDPATEDNYTGDIQDPGTTSPMDADKVGRKYGAWVKKEAAAVSDLANEILADIATGIGLNTNSNQTKQAVAKPAQKTNQVTSPQATAPVTPGYELAALLGLNKNATDNTVAAIVEDVIKRAQSGADRVAACIISNEKEANRLNGLLNKKAVDEEEAAADSPIAEEGAEEAPPEMPPGAADPSMAMPPGGDPAAAMGGLGGPPGGDPAAAMGGAPPGGAGGPGGGPEAALQELAMALMELGIPPEELAAAVQGAGGAGGGMGGGLGGPGGSPGGPPMPPPPGSPAEMGAKIASAVKSFQRSGKFEVRPAKTASERSYRDEMKSYILEIIGATR